MGVVLLMLEGAIPGIHAVGGGGASVLAADGRGRRSTKEEGSTRKQISLSSS